MSTRGCICDFFLDLVPGLLVVRIAFEICQPVLEDAPLPVRQAESGPHPPGPRYFIKLAQSSPRVIGPSALRGLLVQCNSDNPALIGDAAHAPVVAGGR
jgi:hypothetical protein